MSARRMAVAGLLLLAGCTTPAPTIAVESARLVESSDDHRLVETRLRLQNDSDIEVALVEFHYTVNVGGQRFSGRRAAERTIPPRTTVVLDLPAVVGMSSDPTTSASGTVGFVVTGPLERILSDIGLYRPRAGFGGTVELEADGAG